MSFFDSFDASKVSLRGPRVYIQPGYYLAEIAESVFGTSQKSGSPYFAVSLKVLKTIDTVKDSDGKVLSHEPGTTVSCFWKFNPAFMSNVAQFVAEVHGITDASDIDKEWLKELDKHPEHDAYRGMIVRVRAYLVPLKNKEGVFTARQFEVPTVEELKQYASENKEALKTRGQWDTFVGAIKRNNEPIHFDDKEVNEDDTEVEVSEEGFEDLE